MKHKVKVYCPSDRCFMVEIPEQELIQGEKTFLFVNSYTLDNIVLRESTIKSMAETVQKKDLPKKKKASKK